MKRATYPGINGVRTEDRNRGILAMLGGGIYTNQKCPICGEVLRDNFRNALSCPSHPKQKATSFRVHFKAVKKRFDSYSDAYGFLILLRGKTQEQTFDARDYRRDNPLSFSVQMGKFLQHNEKLKSHPHLLWLAKYSKDHFKDASIKEIGYGQLEDFVLSLPDKLSDKSKHDILAVVRQMIRWAYRRKEIATVPEFPLVKYELAWKKILAKEVQEAVLEEVKRISYSRNPRISFAIRLLATYISIRPDEMLSLQEGDIDLTRGTLFIRNEHDKTGKGKTVYLVPEDVEEFRSYPRVTDPSLPFFRHTKAYRGLHMPLLGSQFKESMLNDWWKKACSNLGIEDVGVYAGTKHSSATALRKSFSPEQVRKATGHTTNKSFERYFMTDEQDLRSIYAVARPKEEAEKAGGKEMGKVFALSHDVSE